MGQVKHSGYGGVKMKSSKNEEKKQKELLETTAEKKMKTSRNFDDKNLRENSEDNCNFRNQGQFSELQARFKKSYLAELFS